MKIGALLISILVFSVAGVVLFNEVIGDWYGPDGYDISLQSEYSGPVDVSEETQNISTFIADTTPGGKDGTVESDLCNTVFGSLCVLLTPLSYIKQIPSLISSIFAQGGDKLMISPLWSGLFFTIILIGIAMVAMSAFTNNKVE